jgi:hypothetical protein
VELSKPCCKLMRRGRMRRENEAGAGSMPDPVASDRRSSPKNSAATRRGPDAGARRLAPHTTTDLLDSNADRELVGHRINQVSGHASKYTCLQTSKVLDDCLTKWTQPLKAHGTCGR